MKFSKAVQILKANNMEKSIKASKTIDLLKGIVKKENKAKKNKWETKSSFGPSDDVEAKRVLRSIKKGLTSKSFPLNGVPNRLSIEDSATRVPSASPFRVSSVSIPAMMNQAVYKSCEVHGSLYKSTGNCVRCSVSKSMQCKLGHDLVKSTSHGYHCPKCK